MAKKLVIIGLDCATPAARLRRVARRDAEHQGARRAAGSTGTSSRPIPPDHRPGVDVDDDVAGPGDARRLRIPQPQDPTATRTSTRRTRATSRRRRSGTTSRATASRRSSWASRSPIRRSRSTGSWSSCFLTPEQGPRLHVSRRISRHTLDRVGGRRLHHRRQGVPHERQGVARPADLHDDGAALQGVPPSARARTSGTSP